MGIAAPALFDVAEHTETGVFTTCVGCPRGVEFDGYGGVREPGWAWFDDPDGEWESGWQCPDCRREWEAEEIRRVPFTARTFPC